MSNLYKSVSTVMQKDTIFIDTGASVSELAKLMAKNNVGTVVVTYQNKVEGIVTDRDIVIKVIAKAKNPELMTVSKIMTLNPETINQTDTVRDALTKMADFGFRRLPVVDNNYNLVGLISISDLSSVVKSGNSCAEDILCILNRDERISIPSK